MSSVLLSLGDTHKVPKVPAVLHIENCTYVYLLVCVPGDS